MRLEGTLDAFSLPDIFQLLSFTKKTGGLHLRRQDAHGVVYVTTGSLTGGNADGARQGLARRLVGSGQVDDAAVSAAVSAATDDPDLGIARALQRNGGVDEAVLHGVVTEHVLDTVFDLLRWPDGEFVFVVDEQNPDDVGVSVPVEDAVTEARQRLDAWSTVSTTIPSPDSVLALVLAPVDDPVISRDEWALLALIDGLRPVREIVDLTGRGEFAVVSALASLVDRGLVHVTGPETPSAVPALVRRLALLTALEGEWATPVAPVEEPAPAPENPFAEFTADEPDFVETTAQIETPAPPRQRATAPEEPALPRASRAAVVPARPEPFIGRRAPEHPDDAPTTHVVGSVDGTSAVAAHAAAETVPALIERDPSVNKSLLLRLIAGVRGL